MQDVYLRISASSNFSFGAAENTDGLLFVDVQDGGDPAELRNFPKSFFRNVRYILFRLSNDAYIQYKNDFKDLKRRLDLGAEWFIILQRLGKRAELEPIERANAISKPSEILNRARQIELLALLDKGGGIWGPENHHYLLPSGEHSDFFINMGAAFRTPHDCAVLASWLYPLLTNQMALVVDTARLTPLVLAISCALAKNQWKMGGVIVLEEYPRTLVDLRRAVRDSANSQTLVAILSVSSSGNLRDLLELALDESSRSIFRNKCTIVTMLDLNLKSNFSEEHVWAPGANFLTRGRGHRQQPDKCTLCQSHERSNLVPIDPRTFDAYFPTLIAKVMPDLGDPNRNRSLWQVCSQLNAISLHEQPEGFVKEHRAKGEHLAIKISVRKLLASEDFHHTVVQQLESRKSGAKEEWQALPKPADLLMVPKEESRLPGFAELLEKIKPWLLTPGGMTCAYELREDLAKDAFVYNAVSKAQVVTVFTFGTITGYSLQHGLLGVQEIRRACADSIFELQGFIVHARPRRRREWATLVNSFASSLFCIWLSFISDLSIIDLECQLLRRLDLDTADGDLRSFVLRRLQLIREPAQDLFWCSPQNFRLSPHSIYGEGLSALATLVAVGAALEIRRDAQFPRRSVFPFEDFIRSYFDPLIICSFLRNIRPGEIWWGQSQCDSDAIVTGVLNREADPAARKMLCAELLLAAAQGKIPRIAHRSLVEYANQFSDSSAEIRTGLALLGPT